MSMAGRAGVARRTDGYCRARQAREAFAGLVEPFRSKWDVYRAILRAGADRPIGDGAALTLMLLVDFASTADWQPDREPVVWLSNAELAGLRGKTVPTIERHLAELEAHGIVERRYPRSHRRRIVSLAPAVAVAARLLDRGELARERRRLVAEQAAELGEVTSDVAGVRAHASKAGWSADDRAELVDLEARVRGARSALGRRRRGDGAARGSRREENSNYARKVVKDGRAIWASTARLVDRNVEYSLDEPSMMRGSPRSDAILISTTRTQKDSLCTDWAKDDAVPSTWTAPEPRRQTSAAVTPVVLSDEHLCELSPFFARWQEFLGGSSLGERLQAVGRLACRAVGYPVDRYEAAGTRHGATAVALAALVAEGKPLADLQRRSRAAYLEGMLRRPPGALRPLASLHAASARAVQAPRPEEPPWR